MFTKACISERFQLICLPVYSQKTPSSKHQLQHLRKNISLQSLQLISLFKRNQVKTVTLFHFETCLWKNNGRLARRTVNRLNVLQLGCQNTLIVLIVAQSTVFDKQNIGVQITLVCDRLRGTSSNMPEILALLWGTTHGGKPQLHTPLIISTPIQRRKQQVQKLFHSPARTKSHGASGLLASPHQGATAQIPWFTRQRKGIYFLHFNHGFGVVPASCLCWLTHC